MSYFFRLLKLPIISFFLFTISSNITAQSNLTVLSNLAYDGVNTNSDQRLSDIWGYASATNEYALVGLFDGTSIVDITNPLNPVEVYWVPGAGSSWRDIKTWKNYAYITNETGDGLQIVDLSNLPTLATATNFTGGILAGSSTNISFSEAHNIYIDENGIAYLFGANYGVGGAIMIDVEANPTNPPVVGLYDRAYCHDGYVKNNILYTAEIYGGNFSVVDITDKLNPLVLGTAQTANTFTHNVWLSDDGNYLFTTDEVRGAEIGAYDITDVTDIKRVDGVKSSTGNRVTVHNTHVLNNFLITSYYGDGVTVVDAHCPDILVEVAYFDTSPPSAPSSGCWGAYPFLPSGNIIASDMGNGLFVLNNNYQRASYLTGNVSNQNGTALNNVEITIANFQQSTTSTNLVGDYKTGIPASGIYEVVFTAEGFNPATYLVNFQRGVKTVQNVQFDIATDAACPKNLNISGNIDAGTYEADDIITATGKVNGTSNGSVIFNAGFYANEYIELQQGFEADGTFNFSANNVQCNPTD